MIQTRFKTFYLALLVLLMSVVGNQSSFAKGAETVTQSSSTVLPAFRIEILPIPEGQTAADVITNTLAKIPTSEKAKTAISTDDAEVAKTVLSAEPSLQQTPQIMPYGKIWTEAPTWLERLQTTSVGTKVRSIWKLLKQEAQIRNETYSSKENPHILVMLIANGGINTYRWIHQSSVGTNSSVLNEILSMNLQGGTLGVIALNWLYQVAIERRPNESVLNQIRDINAETAQALLFKSNETFTSITHQWLLDKSKSSLLAVQAIQKVTRHIVKPRIKLLEMTQQRLQNVAENLGQGIDPKIEEELQRIKTRLDRLQELTELTPEQAQQVILEGSIKFTKYLGIVSTNFAVNMAFRTAFYFGDSRLTSSPQAVAEVLGASVIQALTGYLHIENDQRLRELQTANQMNASYISNARWYHMNYGRIKNLTFAYVASLVALMNFEPSAIGFSLAILGMDYVVSKNLDRLFIKLEQSPTANKVRATGDKIFLEAHKFLLSAKETTTKFSGSVCTALFNPSFKIPIKN